MCMGNLFRIILAVGNDPMIDKQTSEILNERWAMSVYPHNLSPRVINRLPVNSANYCIALVEEPDDDGEG